MLGSPLNQGLILVNPNSMQHAKRSSMLPADDEQSVASARRQRRQDGEDRRDENAEAEDELPSEALRQHAARDLS